MSYRIKDTRSGTYYQKWTGIGPMFGGTRDQAHVFADRMEAARTMFRHSFAFTFAEIEEDPAVPPKG